MVPHYRYIIRVSGYTSMMIVQTSELRLYTWWDRGVMFYGRLDLLSTSCRYMTLLHSLSRVLLQGLHSCGPNM